MNAKFTKIASENMSDIKLACMHAWLLWIMNKLQSGYIQSYLSKSENSSRCKDRETNEVISWEMLLDNPDDKAFTWLSWAHKVSWEYFNI
jgi:transcriptional antiterminator Rof (Rho-off)